MGTAAWLARDGEVLAAAEIASDRRARRRGLRGRPKVQGALVIDPCRQVHSFGMRVAVDVAFCAADGTVLAVTTLHPWRISRISLRSRFVVEASAGAFERWSLRPGDQLQILEVPEGEG